MESIKTLKDVIIEKNTQLIKSNSHYKVVLSIVKKYDPDKSIELDTIIDDALDSDYDFLVRFDSDDKESFEYFADDFISEVEKFVSKIKDDQDKKNLIENLESLKKLKIFTVNIETLYNIKSFSVELDGVVKNVRTIDDFFNKVNSKYITSKYIQYILKKITIAYTNNNPIKYYAFMYSNLARSFVYEWLYCHLIYNLIEYCNLNLDKSLPGSLDDFWKLVDIIANKSLKQNIVVDKMKDFFSGLDGLLSKNKIDLKKTPDKKEIEKFLKTIFDHYLKKFVKIIESYIHNIYKHSGYPSDALEMTFRYMITDMKSLFETYTKNSYNRDLKLVNNKNIELLKNKIFNEVNSLNKDTEKQEIVEKAADKSNKPKKFIVPAIATTVVTYLTMYGIIKKTDPNKATLNPLKLVFISFEKTMDSKISLGLKSLLLISAVLFSVAITYLGIQAVSYIVSNIKKK